MISYHPLVLPFSHRLPFLSLLNLQQLNSKRRNIEKNGGEFSDMAQQECERVFAIIADTQKIIDKLRKEQRQHANIVAEHRNKNLTNYFARALPGGPHIRSTGSTPVQDGGTVCEPARNLKKTAPFSATRAVPVPQISPPKLDIPSVSSMNRHVSGSLSFCKPVPSHEIGSYESRGIFPNINLNNPQSSKQRDSELPSSESFDELTLLDHFKKCQRKYRRGSWVGEDMMSTWRMVGHNEATLRNLCREKQPTSQNELKLLFMRELGGIESLPKNHSVTELIAETAAYFIP